MLRRSCLTPALLGCLAFVTNTGCDTSDAPPTETPTPTPEPEPEPEPPKPSNVASQTWAQLWATPTAKPTANLVGVRNGHVYALAGEFVEMGEPATHLVALDEAAGTLTWTHAGKVMLTATGASDVLVALTAAEKPVYVAVKTGKKAKPKKGEVEAITPFDVAPGAEGCTADGVDLTCGSWTVAEGGAVSSSTAFNDQVCYAVATTREVRCRAMSNGDLGFAIAVPAVEGVKDPEAVNFQFMFANGKLFVSNYDGTVLAFGPAAATEEPAADEPAAEPAATDEG